MTPAELRDDLLRILRRDFFAGKSEKEFFQARPMLERAITYPAHYLKNNRGRAILPSARYRSIIVEVVDTIKRHGEPAEWFPRYFLTCVQRHMTHHGDEYYDEAKVFDARSQTFRSTTPRPVGELVGAALKSVSRAPEVDRTLEVFAETHRTLIHRTRSKTKKPAAQELDLFDQCKTVAKPRQ